MPHASAQRTVAVVGCGYWGPRHIRVFNSIPGCRVAWAVDPDPQQLAAIATQFSDVRTAHVIDEVLRDETVNAVVVSSPASTHAAIAVAAMRAGKHVLCEKPLGSSYAECQMMLDAAARYGRVLMTGNVYLFHPAILEMKRLLADGSLGRPYYASSERTNHGPIRTDVNAAWDLAAHEIAIFNFLFDALPTSVSATGRAVSGRGVHDVVALALTYPGGVLAHVLVSWVNARKVRQLSVVGETHLAAFDDLASPSLTLHARRPTATTAPSLPIAEPLKEQARHFLHAMATGDAGRASGAHGTAVVAALEAASASLYSGGAPVEIGALTGPAAV